MGNQAAPQLVNIFFLCNLEDKLINQCHLGNTNQKFYRRYLDDTFIIFNNENSANRFLSYINSLYSNINFTMEKEHNQILTYFIYVYKKAGRRLIHNLGI